MNEATSFALNVGLVLAALLLAYLVGTFLERQHYRSIIEREQRYRTFPVTSFETLPAGWQVESVLFAQGSIVISVDYFKRFVAGLRGLVGGRIKTYEPLLDRARREATLRMVEDARAQGCDAVINVRLETCRIANAGRGNRERTAGVEMLAYGTGLKLAH